MADLFDSVLDMVPQWYMAKHGPHEYTIRLGDEPHSFCCHRRLTPKLDTFHRIAQNHVRTAATVVGAASPSFSDVFQEQLALRWLGLHSSEVDWDKVLRYVYLVSKRTYENNSVAVNVVISSGDGSEDITVPRHQKVFDQLAASPYTFFRVDKRLQFLSYEEIKWSEIKDSTAYEYHPSFLHPFHCILRPKEFSVHLTSNGDVVIMDCYGMIAARRKGRWKVYDTSTFKNSIVDVINGYATGAKLFEVLFDLSFKRHGALLIYDPGFKLRQFIINQDCILEAGHPPDMSPQKVIAKSIKGICIGGSTSEPIQSKRLLVEVASIDGAVVFDSDGLHAVGAIIKTHENAQALGGARTTAAKSAFEYGATPIKISSDGEITIYFRSQDSEGNSCLAVMEFL